MALLENARHEAFAQAIARGMEAGEAYSQVYHDSEGRSAKSHGPRLAKNGVVRARIEELQKMGEDDTVLTMKERRRFFAKVARVDLLDFDPKRDGVLVQEVVEIISRGKDGEETIRKTIKVPGKRECIMDDAKLAGDLVDKVDVRGVTAATPEQILDAVRRSPALRDLPVLVNGNS